MTPSLSDTVAGPSSKTGITIAYFLLGLWAVYVLFAPTIGFAWIDSWHNEQRAVQIVLLSLTALAFAGLIAIGPEAVRLRLQLPWWWWATVALGAVSAMAAPVPFAAFAEIGLFVLLSALVMLTAALTAQRPDRMARAARYFALVIAVAHVLAVLVRYAAALGLGKGIDLSVFMLGYANPRFASALYAVLMPFLAGAVIDSHERRMLRAMAFATLCFLWTINLGLGTRGIWFAYFLAVPGLMLIEGMRRTLRLVGAIAAAAALGVVIFVLLATFASWESGAAPAVALSADRLQTLTSREVLWSLSWQAIVGHPLLGIGPMQFAALKSEVGAHPHNWILQVASEWGLPALVLLMFALVRGLVCLHRNRATGTTASVEALLAIGVSLALGLVDGNLVMPVSQSAVALVLGLLIGSQAKTEPGDLRQPKWRSVSTALVVLAGSIVVSVYAFQTIGSQPAVAREFLSAYSGAWLVPRFWESGNIVPINPYR